MQIKEKIQDEERSRQVDEYLERLKRDTYVWTIFDDTEDADEVAGRSDGESSGTGQPGGRW